MRAEEYTGSRKEKETESKKKADRKAWREPGSTHPCGSDALILLVSIQWVFWPWGCLGLPSVCAKNRILKFECKHNADAMEH